MIRPLLLISLFLGSIHAATAALYVSPRGTTGADGTRSSPLTLAAALEKARTNPDIEEILLLEGTYAFTETVEIPAFVRSTSNPLVIRSESSDRPAVLTGGRSLRGLWTTPSGSDAIVARMPDAARSAVRVVDLRAAGISDFGTFSKRGFDGRKMAPGELFIAGWRQTIAGYPNPGQWKGDESDPMGIENGYQRYHRSEGWEVDLPKEVAGRWKNVNLKGTWAHGYFGTDWADAHLPVAGVDAVNGQLILGSIPSTGFKHYGAYRVYNLPEELDSAGEWYLDRNSGKLYYWPISDTAINSSAFSVLEGPILHIAHSRNLHFANLVFHISRGDLVTVDNSKGIVFRQSEFRGSGIKGLLLNGEHNRVVECLFEGIADTPVHMTGGDHDVLRPSANLAVNNVIRDYGQVYFAYSAGIYMNGVGNTAAHNLIHDAPHEGIQVNGALNRIYRNEIFDVCQYTDDAGAIYSGRDFTGWGNQIVENYVHDIRTHRFDHAWVHAVYLDDFASGFTVRGNIFEDIDGYATDMGGGRYNIVDANLFLDAAGGHINDNRGAKWIVTTPGDSWNMFEEISAVNRKSDPWKSTFPGLAMVPDYIDGAMNYVYPDGNEFTRNAGDRVGDWVNEQDWTGRDEGVFRHYAKFDPHPISASVTADVDLAGKSLRNDIKLAKDNLVIPFSRIGLQDDTWSGSPTSKSSAVANFSWAADEFRVGSRATFFSGNSWSSANDPIARRTWTINGSQVGNGRTLAWTPSATGTYRVQLRVTTASGHQNAAEYIFVVSGSKSRPATWLDRPQTVPGVVEVEFFDHGRYFDTKSGNSGGALRDGDVDIGLYQGEHYIGWTQPEEWFEIGVNAEAATYDVFIRAASRIDDMGIAFRWDGELVAGVVLPNVDNNMNFTRYHVGRINVPVAGRHTLRLDLLGKDFNIDHVELVKAGPPAEPEIEPQPEPMPEPAPEPAPAPTPEADGAGALKVAYYHDILGSAIGDLEADADFPANPSAESSVATFELPAINRENYGVRVTGWLVPEVSGTYEFFIASDDNGSLRLSSDANPGNAIEIARVPGHTKARQFDRFPEQQSAKFQLEAGHGYYIEAVMKQGWSGANLSVAWRGPGIALEVIPASVLSPSAPEPVPTLEFGAAAFARYNNIGGSQLTDLYAAAKFPEAPDSTTEFTTFEYSGGGDNFGLYAWAWLVPEKSGDYTFWIASDDEGVLSLSTNSDSSNAQVIARVVPHSPARDYDRHPEQKSATVRLEAGRAYYIEALMKQGWSGSNLSVAWQGPGFSRQVIPGRVLGLLANVGDNMPSGDEETVESAPAPEDSIEENIAEPTPDASNGSGVDSPVSMELTGTVNLAHYRNMAGNQLEQLYGSAKFPDAPDAINEIDHFSYSGGGDNYGLFAWAWLVPETTGDYTFWIASDDQGELLLSGSADAAGAKRIASVPSHSGRELFDRFIEQKSTTIRLEAGKAYYLAAAMKQGWSDAHLSVAWQGPGFAREIIPGTVLTADQPEVSLESTLITGGVAIARYDGIRGSTLVDLESAAKFPEQPDATAVFGNFEFIGTGTNFGLMAWAWLIPEVSGHYRFWLASDDQGELRLSQNSDWADSQVIASVGSHTKPGEYDKMPSQQSAEIYLEAGRAYYIEAISQQGWGNVNLSVAWQGPGFARETVPGRVLALPEATGDNPPSVE